MDPDTGRARAVVRERYRSLAVGRDEVFYTYDDDHVSVVRVLHVAMDPDHWLG